MGKRKMLQTVRGNVKAAKAPAQDSKVQPSSGCNGVTGGEIPSPHTYNSEVRQTRSQSMKARTALVSPLSNSLSPSPLTTENQPYYVRQLNLKCNKSVSDSIAETQSKLPRALTTPPGNKYVGAHVSIAGGITNAPANAAEIGARAFGLFLRNQRSWNSKDLTEDDALMFKNSCAQLGFALDKIVPHGIYLMNCGSPDPETVARSQKALVDEHKRCEMLGLCYYNFHPGSTCGKISREECISQIAGCIDLAHSETKKVVTLVENMCGQGFTVGGTFEELRDIIQSVKDKSRVGVCFDTCHAFASGYDLSTSDSFERVMKQFDEIIGLKFLKAVHLNDSKGQLASHLDRHENIGKGYLGKECFQFIMNDARFEGIPMILETPQVDSDADEIRRLYSYVC